MSAETFTYVILTCDACDDEAPRVGARSVFEARAEARAAGWKFERKWNRDLCDKCKATEGIVPDQRSKS